MDSYLRCVFKMDDGKNRTFSLRHPKTGLSAVPVQAFMDECLLQQPFDMDIASIVGAELITRTVTNLI